MSVLTKKEQAWVLRVQKALDACPIKGKFGFYTTGDIYINMYDLRRMEDVFALMDGSNGVQDFGPACDHLAVNFDESLSFPSPVESTAG